MNGQNNGGKNPFYRIPKDVKTIDSLIDYLKMSRDDIKTFFKAWDYRKNKEICTWYEFSVWVNDVDTLNEWLGDSFYFGNFLKTFWVNIGIRHDGTSISRELNKRQHYLNRLVWSQQRGEINVLR